MIAPPKTPEVPAETAVPDLVVEENGKFSVQSSSEEKIEDEEQPAEETTVAETTVEATTQNETEVTTRSTSSMGQSTWSVTQSNTDDYKVSLFPSVELYHRIRNHGEYDVSDPPGNDCSMAK